MALDLWIAEIGVRKELLANPDDFRLVEQLQRAQQARNDPFERPSAGCVPTWEAPNEYAFIYTHGLQWDGLPELVSRATRFQPHLQSRIMWPRCFKMASPSLLMEIRFRLEI